MSDRAELVFSFVRRVVCLLLGVLIILNGLFTDNDTTFAVIAGAFFVGILPLDHLLASWIRPRREPEVRP
jgi:hypothetical protein